MEYCMSCKVCYIFNKTMLIITVHPSLHVVIPLTQTGATPLHIASGMGRSDVVHILIRNGADVNLAHNVRRYNVATIHSHCITVEGSATRLTGLLMYMSTVLSG